MVGDLGVRPNVDGGVTVWRVPTLWDRLAYAIPSVFCLGATIGGISLSVVYGARFLLLVFPALFLSVFFLLLGTRAVGTVVVDSRGLVIMRVIQSPIVISPLLVNDIAAEIGNRAYELGVIIRHSDGKRVVLHGLSEKDRVTAALTLCEALNTTVPMSMVGSDSDNGVV